MATVYPAYTGTMLSALALLAVSWSYDVRHIEGWTVKVRQELLMADRVDTQEKIKLIADQLHTVAKLVPSKALKKLRQVTIYVSPEYKGVPPTAEYHPEANWLKENGRDPAMAKCVEVTNLRILKQEIDRMPVLFLHELAHAYHDQVFGFDNPEIVAAYEKAKASGKYDKVERWHGTGKPNTFERHYAMTNPMEYFAEGTEAYFARNDFYPFTRQDLQAVDPELCRLLKQFWGA